MHYYFNDENCEIIAKETADPNQTGIHFKTAEELAASEVPVSAMLKWINDGMEADKKLKKFATRLAGAKRIMKELGHLTSEGDVALANESDSGLHESKSATTPSIKPFDDTPTAPSRRGRKSVYAGRIIIATVEPDQDGSIFNPRREGTQGFRSMQIILVAGQISYEDYIDAGGRNNDLAWDIAHGSAVLKD
jgi:hypothetical protein